MDAQVQKRLPKFMNTDDKYKNVIDTLNDEHKYMKFMEERFIVNALKLSAPEIFDVIQQISKDVIATHKLDPYTIQGWNVTFKSIYDADSHDAHTSSSSSDTTTDSGDTTDDNDESLSSADETSENESVCDKSADEQ
jgi:hypothetical protein